jgi:hypothetical protein
VFKPLNMARARAGAAVQGHRSAVALQRKIRGEACRLGQHRSGAAAQSDQRVTTSRGRRAAGRRRPTGQAWSAERGEKQREGTATEQGLALLWHQVRVSDASASLWTAGGEVNASTPWRLRRRIDDTRSCRCRGEARSPRELQTAGPYLAASSDEAVARGNESCACGMRWGRAPYNGNAQPSRDAAAQGRAREGECVGEPPRADG